ncbi:MAG: NlpC/P60 family protein [Pseudomonadota bacterium]
MLSYDDQRLRLADGGAGQVMQVSAGVTALRADPKPDAMQVSQVLFGEAVTLHHEQGAFGLVQCHLDGYVGWALLDALTAPILAPTHRVTAARLHTYVEPKITAAPHLVLSAGARLRATGDQDGRYIRFERAGWIVDHLVSPIDVTETDPASVAERFLGTPYLWGGRDGRGIDCSGLMQIAFDACGISAPRDSDMQRDWFGDAIDDWQEPGALQRNDLISWKGHCGIMLDASTLLHANATFMKTIQEPLQPAIARIATEYGEPLGARRVDLDKWCGVKPAWLTLPA